VGIDRRGAINPNLAEMVVAKKTLGCLILGAIAGVRLLIRLEYGLIGKYRKTSATSLNGLVAQSLLRVQFS
jgi:uncharacterized membrane protein